MTNKKHKRSWHYIFAEVDKSRLLKQILRHQACNANCNMLLIPFLTAALCLQLLGSTGAQRPSALCILRRRRKALTRRIQRSKPATLVR